MAAKRDIQVGGGSRRDAEPELHRCAALDDEQVASVCVADLVEHRADRSDADKVHHTLRELADVGRVTL